MLTIFKETFYSILSEFQLMPQLNLENRILKKKYQVPKPKLANLNKHFWIKFESTREFKLEVSSQNFEGR